MPPTDPLNNINQLSGATYASILTKDCKRIILLGDVHLPANKLLCSNCYASKKCYNIIQFIHLLADYHFGTATHFDMFCEAFAPTDVLHQTTTNTVKRNYNANPSILLAAVRKEFSDQIYRHKRNRRIRFHYVDIRSSPFLQKTGLTFLLWLMFSNVSSSPEWFGTGFELYLNLFLRSYPTFHSFKSAILHICFTSKDPTNVVVKQFNKLPSTAFKTHIKDFIIRKLNALNKIFPYSSKKTVMSTIFWGTALLMDCYTICRFLRFFVNQPAGSTTVFFEGAGHCWIVLEFLKELDAKQHFNNFPKSIKDLFNDELTYSSSRCVYLADVKAKDTKEC